MLAPETIRDLKAQHKYIFQTKAEGKTYVFRPLTFGEFDLVARLYGKKSEVADAEEAILNTAILIPNPATIEFDSFSAGVITSLAEEILEVSGFGEDEGVVAELLEERREEANSFRRMMYAFIIAAMPSYNDDDLDKYTFRDLAAKLALAEKILEIRASGPGVKLNVGSEAAVSMPTPDPRPGIREPGEAPAHDPIAQKLHRALGG